MDHQKHGKGTLIYPDLYQYEGEWKDNKFNGKGTKKNSDGSIYEGEFKDGKKHKQGTLILNNGDRYEGNFEILLNKMRFFYPPLISWLSIEICG